MAEFGRSIDGIVAVLIKTDRYLASIERRV